MTIFLQKHTSTKGRHFKKELFAHFCPTCFPKNVGQKCANFWCYMALPSNSFVKWPLNRKRAFEFSKTNFKKNRY